MACDLRCIKFYLVIAIVYGSCILLVVKTIIILLGTDMKFSFANIMSPNYILCLAFTLLLQEWAELSYRQLTCSGCSKHHNPYLMMINPDKYSIILRLIYRTYCYT